jgi:hypothetical protein
MKRLLPALLFVSACQPAPDDASEAALAANAALQAARALTAQDRIVHGADGNRYYQTAYNGALYRVSPIIPRAIIPPRPLPPLPLLPSRRMLDEEGLVTPARDQGGRGTCTIFSSVGAIEAEYRAQGLNLDLSEEYLINMMNEDREPSWAGGDVAEKLYVASYYGLPPEANWPYISSETPIITDLDNIFGVNPNDTNAQNALMTQIWNDPLTRDVANYNTVIYPPPSAHPGAIYGPVADQLSGVTLNGLDPTPLEAVIAAGHTISFMTATGAWSFDATTQVMNYNPSGDQTTDHAILLVGYDHAKQVFRIKNSWGSWNGNGFADFSYDLVMRTIVEPTYVTSVRAPSAAVGGNGTWKGLWRAVLEGHSGVAVIHHAFANEGHTTVAGPDAGLFYGDDGVNYTLEWTGGGGTTAWLSYSNTANAGDSGTILLTLQSGGESAALAADDSAGRSCSGAWVRCATPPSASQLMPKSYGATTQDPYAFTQSASCGAPSWVLNRIIGGGRCPDGCRCRTVNGKVSVIPGTCV